MVAPAFGFSVGDFIAATKLLIEVINSFKESGGAADKFASETAFLTSLVSTVGHVNDYMLGTPPNDIATDIAKLTALMKKPLSEFKKFLDKHEAALGKRPTKSALGKVKLTMNFTMKDVSGKIEKLRRQVEQPLQAVNTLLALQVLRSIKEVQNKPLQKEQLLQIVEAIKMADVPNELQKQIDVLQRSAANHERSHDHQLERIVELRDILTGKLNTLQERINGTTVLVSTEETDQQRNTRPQIESHDSEMQGLKEEWQFRSGELEKAAKEQSRLLLALETFLEEKATLQKDFLEEVRLEKVDQNTWPSATLPTAHLATVLLSALVSSIVATTIRLKDKDTGQATPLQALTLSSHNQASRAQALNLNSIQHTQNMATAIPPGQSPQAQASRWVNDFKRDTGMPATVQSKWNSGSQIAQPQRVLEDSIPARKTSSGDVNTTEPGPTDSWYNLSWWKTKDSKTTYKTPANGINTISSLSANKQYGQGRSSYMDYDRSRMGSEVLTLAHNPSTHDTNSIIHWPTRTGTSRSRWMSKLNEDNPKEDTTPNYSDTNPFLSPGLVGSGPIDAPSGSISGPSFQHCPFCCSPITMDGICVTCANKSTGNGYGTSSALFSGFFNVPSG